MQIKLELPDPEDDQGFKFAWEKDFSITAKIHQNRTVIQANQAGLISLAKHLLQLAQERFGDKYYFYLDSSNSLEPDSSDLIFQKVDSPYGLPE